MILLLLGLFPISFTLGLIWAIFDLQTALTALIGVCLMIKYRWRLEPLCAKVVGGILGIGSICSRAVQYRVL